MRLLRELVREHGVTRIRSCGLAPAPCAWDGTRWEKWPKSGPSPQRVRNILANAVEMVDGGPDELGKRRTACWKRFRKFVHTKKLEPAAGSPEKKVQDENTVDAGWPGSPPVIFGRVSGTARAGAANEPWKNEACRQLGLKLDEAELKFSCCK